MSSAASDIVFRQDGAEKDRTVSGADEEIETLAVSIYPNPFNPVTTIRYALSEALHVHLAIYDLLGREVALLVDRGQSSGMHEARFDASQLSNGTYLYRLEVGGECSQGRWC